MSDNRDLNIFNLTHTSIRQFVFFMKAIADNNLWDEAEQHLKSRGCTRIILSVEPIGAIQQMLQQKIQQKPSAGNKLTPQIIRVSGSISCLHPVGPLPDPHPPEPPGGRPGGPPPGPPEPDPDPGDGGV
jgi:hypothetical protein